MTLPTVICINVGSSSIKAAKYERNHEAVRVAIDTHEQSPKVFNYVLDQLQIDPSDGDLTFAHRVVHGGIRNAPSFIDDSLVEELQSLTQLAPLHLPPALRMIEVARKEFPQATHIACFDTSFHQTMPENVWRYPLPNSVATSDIRRYGFHGLSCQHVVSELEPSRSKRAVIAHLGNGCSITAIKNGESVATTMGFTPIGGVIMSTRTGDIDPGLLLHLLRNGHNIDELTRAISYESGLKAIANTSDMKVIIEKASSEPRCNLALQMFCDRIAQQIGAYAVLLNGLDTVVFTGGIGEHAQVVRDRILNSLEILQPFETAIVKANEELVMKDEALRLLQEN